MLRSCMLGLAFLALMFSLLTFIFCCIMTAPAIPAMIFSGINIIFGREDGADLFYLFERNYIMCTLILVLWMLISVVATLLISAGYRRFILFHW